VHAYGTPRIDEDEGASRTHLERLVAAQEAGLDPQWRLDSQPEEFVEAMVKGVVAFELPIDTLEGKWKMSQNRAPEDRESAAAALAESDDPLARAVAAMMTARDR
jgi:transcriptional regulator